MCNVLVHARGSTQRYDTPSNSQNIIRSTQLHHNIMQHNHQHGGCTRGKDDAGEGVPWRRASERLPPRRRVLMLRLVDLQALQPLLDPQHQLPLAPLAPGRLGVEPG